MHQNGLRANFTSWVYADLSANSALNAISRDPEFGRDFLLEFQDRLLYGRDDFHNRLQEHLNSLDLPQTVLDKIYFQNAQKLLRKNHS